MNKKCSRCKNYKPIEMFSIGQGWRKQCHANHHKIKWERDEEYRKKLRDNRDRLAKECTEEMIRSKSVPCPDCGRTYPYYVMDFHHKDGSKKISPVSRLKSYGMEKLLAEIEKCEIVCSNCHRIRTYSSKFGK